MHLIDVCITVFMAFSNILIFQKLYLILEILTKTYRNACSEGEVVMYRAHVAVLGDSKAINFYFSSYLDTKRKGIKTRQIESKFNKSAQETERWEESVSNPSELKTKFRDAVLSHIRSIQHGSQAKGVMETQQQSICFQQIQ